MKRLRVYIAGPYTKGDKLDNVRRAIDAATIVLALGHFPYIPHLTHYWDERHPHDYETWMELDFAYLDVCDVLIRLSGESPGADREVEQARAKGIRVFDSIEAFKRFDEEQKRNVKIASNGARLKLDSVTMGRSFRKGLVYLVEGEWPDDNELLQIVDNGWPCNFGGSVNKRVDTVRGPYAVVTVYTD